MEDLPRFESRETIGTKIAITNAGDGLSKAMSIEPEVFHLGDRVYVVLETTVDKITYQPSKEGDGVIRVQSLKAGTATTVDQTMVDDVLEEQRVKIEEAEGVVRLDFATDPEDEDGDGFEVDDSAIRADEREPADGS